MDWNFRNDQLIYSQLTQRLTEAIVSGIYAPGEKLPSVRELAVEAGVNPNTVQRALSELERDGLVFSQRTAGRFVTENENMIANAKLRIADERVGEFLHSITKNYGAKTALDSIDLTIEPGRIVGLLGPNGSGKTTLIKLANGLLTPTSGEILIAGKAPCRATKAIVSYLPDRNTLPGWMTIAQALDYYGDFYSDFRRGVAEAMLMNLGLDRTQKIKTLSKGMREKTQLILTMSREAKLYLLDEPIGGVDPATRDYILRTIIGNYSEDAAVIISTHLIADVEQILDEVVFLREGQVMLHESVETIRDEKGKSVDELFREVFRC